VAQLDASDDVHLRAGHSARPAKRAGRRFRRAFALSRRRPDPTARPRAAAQARHACELAYGKLSREDDASWLARVALADFGAHASPALRSTLLSLQARTLLESERLDLEQRRTRVFELLDEAQRLAARDRFGARELPRLDILRGFMEYSVGKPGEASAFFAKAASQCEALKDWECHARALQNSASSGRAHDSQWR
jgi:hypothetical protein